MKVLFAVYELAPFFQVGGLGDVARSLPKALHALSIDIRLIIPYYKALKLHKQRKKLIKNFFVTYDGKKEKVNLYETHFLNSKLPVYILRNKKYLDIPSKDTFGFFNLAVFMIVKNNILNWVPEIVHCNDHHTGFIPFLIKHSNLPIKTIMTIHNINHQGKTSIETIKKINLDHTKCKVIDWEIKKRQINFLLEGIIHADLVNTVSPTYAKEVMTEEYAAGLDEIMRNAKNKISGLLNGIDYDTRCPLKDKNITYHYSAKDTEEKYPYKIYSPMEGKKLNKAFLQEKFNFEILWESAKLS